MQTTTEAQFAQFLLQSGIVRSAKEMGIGAQLSIESQCLRSVVIHFQEEEPREHQEQVLKNLFALAPHWFIFPRYGNVCDLLGKPALAESPAAIVPNSSAEETISAMVTLQESLKVIDYDPYFISSSGKILATWDHHVFSDGFCVRFSDISSSTEFITSLNESGTEFDVFSANA